MPVPSPAAPANAITQTAMALITSAMRLIGVLSGNESPSVADANTGLSVLNQMLDAWNADRLAIYTTSSQDFPFTAGKQSYTLGTGGDWDTTRPPAIVSMSAILLNNPENPVEWPIPIFTVREWQEKLPVKAVNSSFPALCYDDGGFPLRTLNFWPVPQDADNCRIYSWQGLGLPTSLQGSMAFPPGYAEAFRYNLAVRLSGEFAAPLPASVQQIAVESLARVKTMNAPDLTLHSDLVSATDDAQQWRATMFGIPY